MPGLVAYYEYLKIHERCSWVSSFVCTPTYIYRETLVCSHTHSRQHHTGRNVTFIIINNKTSCFTNAYRKCYGAAISPVALIKLMFIAHRLCDLCAVMQ